MRANSGRAFLNALRLAILWFLLSNAAWGAAAVEPTGSRPITVFLVLEDEPVAAIAAGVRTPLALANVATQTKRRGLQLQQRQAALQTQLAVSGAQVTGRFTRVVNALRVVTREDQLPQLAALPGVRRVQRVHRYERHLSSSLPFAGVPVAWSNALASADGRDIRVGIIDSGIDYLHADFGGSGSSAVYAANDPTRIEPGSFPTAKVVGGFDFAGDAYNPGEEGHERPVPDPDPLDCRGNGHGTHVAGIAAGFGVLTNGQTYTGAYHADLDLRQFSLAPGVAPRALLYALKVFGCSGPTDVVTDALEWAADPNGDFDLGDRLDVVNLSLGGDFGALDPEDAELTSVDRLADLGCVVVCSAGNSENIFYVVSAPGVAQRTLCVANSIDEGKGQAIDVLSPASIAGRYYLVEGAITQSLTNSGPVTGRLVYVQPPLGCESPANADALRGNIALIDRGTCLFSDKILAAQDAGAIGVVMVNNLDGAPIPMGGDGTGIHLPGGMIAKSDGALLKAHLDETVFVRLDAEHTVDRPEFVDTLSDSSSRGPSSPFCLLKPDLSAPGSSIQSARAGSGNEGITLSGTSMAAPMVSGAAALLRQLHPEWGVEAVKAALMNTAHPIHDSKGHPYPESRMGAGRLQVDAAARTEVTAEAVSDDGRVGLSFGSLVLTAPHQETRKLRLENHSDRALTLQVTVSNSVSQSGVEVRALADSVTLAAQGAAELEVQLRADPSAMALQPDDTTEGNIGAGTVLPRHVLFEVSGQVWFTSAEAALHLPYHAAVRAASDFHAETNSIVIPASDSRARQLDLAVRFQGKATSTNLVPLVSAFELGDTSARKPLTDANRAAADLLAVGVATDLASVPSFGDSTVYFGLATAGSWTAPQQVLTRLQILIDVNQDGYEDYLIQNDNASVTNSGGAKDAFFSVVMEVGPDFEILSTNAPAYLNLFSPDVLDTAIFNNNVVVLSAPASLIGLTSKATAFRYKVFTSTSSGSVDQTGWIPYDVAHPVLDTTRFSVDGTPMFDDGLVLRVRLDRDAARRSGQRLPRLLLLHHLGPPDRRVEIVTFDLGLDDTDNDGLPDWWEQQSFSSLAAAAKDSDFDGDGAPDRYEFLAGTNPADAKSVFKLVSATRVSRSNIAVRWSGVAGQVYRLERATDLSAGFTTVRDDIKATPPMSSFTDTEAAGDGPFFYRVWLKP